MKKKIIILGGGESGVGAALLAQQNGFDVFLSDAGELKGIYKAELNKAHIEFGLLYVNDFIEGKQYLLAKFFRDEHRSQFVMPHFINDEYGIGHCYYSHTQIAPLEISNLQPVILKKQIG